jgi:hypothetical protein
MASRRRPTSPGETLHYPCKAALLLGARSGSLPQAGLREWQLHRLDPGASGERVAPPRRDADSPTSPNGLADAFGLRGFIDRRGGA